MRKLIPVYYIYITEWYVVWVTEGKTKQGHKQTILMGLMGAIPLCSIKCSDILFRL